MARDGKTTKPKMIADGLPVPIADIELYVQQFPDEAPPATWINLHSDSDDESIGGVALNCVNVGYAPSLEAIYGKRFRLSNAEDSGDELTESVFWTPGHRTLELDELSFQFDRAANGLIAVAIQAVCSDHSRNSDIVVSVTGNVRMHADSQ